ncbi:DUF4382 domain-containing protein [Marinobacter goseongensis]|uniref:DUF4382 domain-containing protein n=1 Tax=Marinobacter goseongensis TaxID=453838 RepID=UPI0020046FB2|nr:DUF4382 domain-containing protein [Marinobacter goseongensis]MCK7553099.1 DUF4382 domain-containing protein [Marinobacter goseongensis]
MNSTLKMFAVSALTAGIAGCGGGGSGSSDSTGTVSFGITDAPATDLSNVTVAFTEIRLKPTDGDWISFPLEGFETVNMLDLQGGVSEPLITDQEVPAGEYSQVRLIVDTENSFVKRSDTGDTEFSLAVPSGEQSGLKLQGDFIVAADTSTSFTIDFDVRKAVVDPQGNALADFMLRPALRLVNNLEVGSIAGSVDESTIIQVRCSVNDPAYDGMVYVYQGSDATIGDLGSENEPLLTAPVAFDGEVSEYNYTAAFLMEGEYTVSYTCDPDDNEAAQELTFLGTRNVTVTAESQTTVDFVAE